MFRTAIPPRRRGRLVRRPLPPPASAPAEPAVSLVGFSPPLHALGAFAIATAAVVTTASASVAAVMAYLDVHNTAEFAACMRTWMASSMPHLTAKIYRRPTPLDTALDDPLLAAQHTSDVPTTFDHDAAQQRLADAFDNGGFDAWVQAATKELEAESEVERAGKR